MPELPEVETVVRGLKKEIIDHRITKIRCDHKRIISSGFIQFKNELTGNKAKKIIRHGKYIFLLLNTNKMVVVHLRMTGQLYLIDNEQKIDKHTHLEIYFKGLPHKLIYRDVRKFGGFELTAGQDIQGYIRKKKLAPDALSITDNIFVNNVCKKNKNIKAVLLDQHIIAGLGNIYVDEVLIRAKVSPKRSGNKLKKKELGVLLKTIKVVLKEAVLKKGTSFSDYVNTYGKKGKFQLVLKAYQQDGKPCYHCGTVIVKEKIAGRGTHFCPKCQK